MKQPLNMMFMLLVPGLLFTQTKTGDTKDTPPQAGVEISCKAIAMTAPEGNMRVVIRKVINYPDGKRDILPVEYSETIKKASEECGKWVEKEGKLLQKKVHKDKK
jgi:hypothetical protein